MTVRASPLREVLLGSLILALGLGARLGFIALFPTRAISDFESIVGFAIWFRDHAWLDSWHWRFLTPGLPLTLSVLLRIFPGDPGEVSRTATAVVCGLVPLLPFLLWRGVLPLSVRALAGFSLALWPGQVFFSGVVAQDNWILLPAVALGALAARVLTSRGAGHPVAAGLLFALGVLIRQEMLVVLLPLLAGAAGLFSREGRTARRLAWGALATVGPLLLFMAHRGVVTGRYALTSEHPGLALLGSYIPGATEDSWLDPRPYVAAVEPALLREPGRLSREASRLAWREALRRPGFHAARITASALRFAVTSEGDNLYWSVGQPAALPEPLQARGQAFMERLGRPLRAEMLLLQGLFLASLVLALGLRDPSVPLLAATVALKIGIHGLVVAQSRYVLMATALEMLAIGLAAGLAARTWPASRRTLSVAAASGLVGALALGLLVDPAMAWVKRRDRIDPQLHYRFPLFNWVWTQILFDCEVSRGRLLLLEPRPRLRLALQDPAPGDVAAIDCVTTRVRSNPLVLRVYDPYALGGLPGRIVERVEVDGTEALAWDVGAEPWTGWHEVPISPDVGSFRVELVAVAPDPGAAWGAAVPLEIELAAKPATEGAR